MTLLKKSFIRCAWWRHQHYSACCVYAGGFEKYKIQGELSKVFNDRKLDIPLVVVEALINPLKKDKNQIT